MSRVSGNMPLHSSDHMHEEEAMPSASEVPNGFFPFAEGNASICARGGLIALNQPASCVSNW